ncbi:MAG: c-type cytochrome [Acidobacteria bacterium]|nr:c-type cytochrome [Acidobacteriota bacterium]
MIGNYVGGLRDFRIFLAALALVVWSGGWFGCRRAPEGSQATGNLIPTARLESSDRLLQLGKQTYDRNCAPCHGLNGDSQGPAAYLLYPKPRDFTTVRYRLVSTWDFTPADEDLFRTISRGMPGSAMPSWAHLTEETRWGLVHYIKSFAKRPLEIGPDHQPQGPTDSPSGRVEVPPEPSYTPAAEARARELYAKNCANCHGPTGRGDGPEKQEDSEGLPVRPRDLSAGIYKGSPEPQEVYKRITAGLPGSPMPSHPHLYGEDAWHLVHFVRSMSSDEQRARMEMKRFQIVATHVPQLPGHPDDSIWRSTPAVELHLMPLWWRDQRPETVAVQALHDGKEIAFQRIWSDPTHDHTAIRHEDFRDAAAIEFSLSPQDPPFFGMGEGIHGAAVNIWMWKSERQADLEPAYQDIDKQYPNIGIDSYPNLMRSPLEQPTRHALTLESDPTFVTGWGAGNIVSDPTRKSAAEDLSASGFGTLKAHPIQTDQHVSANGVYGTGSYRVVFRRPLKVGAPGNVELQPGSTHPVAFAVWDGSAQDRDGKKSITVWQDLVIAE